MNKQFEPPLTVAEILTEIQAIEKKIDYLNQIKFDEVQVWYKKKDVWVYEHLYQSVIPFSLSMEVNKLIRDSIKKHELTKQNLTELLKQIK